MFFEYLSVSIYYRTEIIFENNCIHTKSKTLSGIKV